MVKVIDKKVVLGFGHLLSFYYVPVIDVITIISYCLHLYLSIYQSLTVYQVLY